MREISIEDLARKKSFPFNNNDYELMDKSFKSWNGIAEWIY